MLRALHPRPVRYFASIGSTNDEALSWLAGGAPEGALVVADEQTKGRGRLGRVWYAPPGSALLLTVILRPSERVLSRMTMLGGLVVCETAQQMGLAAGIKWANDVQVNGRKLSGVLPEASWNGSRLNGVILGMGVNINVDFSDSPFAQTATSFQTLMGSPQSRLEILQRILARMDAWRNRLDTAEFFEAWRANLNMLGQFVTIDGRRGLAENVDREGALLIRDDAGVQHRVVAGDLGVG